MIKYTDTQIKNIANLLNNLTVKGVENAKRIAIIAQILDEGIPEKDEEKQ